MLSVQALRGVAALAVVIVHFDYVRVILANRANEVSPLFPFASGVDLFFVISGFIIVHSSSDLFEKPKGWLTFFTRRVARIVPLYWLATAAAIPLMAMPPVDIQSILYSLFFIPYRNGNGTVFPLHAGGWTLNFEMFFYVLFGSLLFLERRRAIAALCTVLVTLVIIGQIFRPKFAPLLIWSDALLLEFLFGVLIAVAYHDFNVRLAMPVRIFLCIAGVTVIALFPAYGGFPSGLRFLTWGLPAAAIFAGVVLADDIKPGWLTAPIRMLGDASYAVYLIHPMFGTLIFIFWASTLQYYQTIPMLIIVALASVAFSIGVFYLFEKRATLFTRRTLVSMYRPSWQVR